MRKARSGRRGALDCQSLAPARPSPAENSSAAAGSHPHAETVRSCTASVVRLKGPLHKSPCSGKPAAGKLSGNYRFYPGQPPPSTPTTGATTPNEVKKLSQRPPPEEPNDGTFGFAFFSFAAPDPLCYPPWPPREPHPLGLPHAVNFPVENRGFRIEARGRGRFLLAAVGQEVSRTQFHSTRHNVAKPAMSSQGSATIKNESKVASREHLE